MKYVLVLNYKKYNVIFWLFSSLVLSVQASEQEQKVILSPENHIDLAMLAYEKNVLAYAHAMYDVKQLIGVLVYKIPKFEHKIDDREFIRSLIASERIVELYNAGMPFLRGELLEWDSVIMIQYLFMKRLFGSYKHE